MLALGVALLSACAAPTRDSESETAACASDEVRGPLGSCVKVHVRQPCDQCQTNADCGGAICGPIEGDTSGCFFCQKPTFPPPPPGPPDAGSGECAADICENGVRCCDGLVCQRNGEVVCGGRCDDGKDTCLFDEDCPPDAACVAVLAPCTCDRQPHTQCVPRCESGRCPEGTACGEHHVCEVLRCDRPIDGVTFTCPDGGTCDPAKNVDVHGCTIPPCTDGEPCGGDGKCIMGTCQHVARCAPLGLEIP